MPRGAVTAAALRPVLTTAVRPWLGPHLPPRVQRLGIDALCATLPRARVEHHAGRVAGVPVLIHEPADARPGAAILYFHGGGYVTGSARAYRALTSRLARAARARVLSADYRLAPEHPFPAAPDDALAIYTALLDGGQAPAGLTLAGDSAGGGLALATVLNARERGLELPGRLILFSPWLELGPVPAPVGTADRADPLLPRAGLERWSRLYRAGQPAEDPRCSPGLAGDLSGLPPTLVQYDRGELLAGDATRFAARAQAAGSAVQLQAFDDLWHVFQLFTQLPQARDAIATAGAFALGPDR
jgi:monoterpene epsilon-lactone hydrolase